MFRTAIIAGMFGLVGLSACGEIQQQAKVATPIGRPRVAGPGDTVLDMRLTESLPNVFGKADIYGRTRDRGRVIVRYVGQQGESAVFVRQDVVIQSNDTTMSRTPLVMPTYQASTMTGNVGTIPVSGTSTTIGTTYIPPSPSTDYPVQGNSIQLAAPVGGSVIVEGRRINVLRAVSGGIEYSVSD
jgi:hypothetical protein